MAIILKGMKFKKIFPTCDMCHEQTVMFTIKLHDCQGNLVSALHVCSLCHTSFVAGDDFTLEVVPYDDGKTPGVGKV